METPVVWQKVTVHLPNSSTAGQECWLKETRLSDMVLGGWNQLCLFPQGQLAVFCVPEVSPNTGCELPALSSGFISSQTVRLLMWAAVTWASKKTGVMASILVSTNVMLLLDF